MVARRRRREPNSRDTNLKRAGRGGRRRRRGGILFHSVLATQPNTEEEGRKEKIGGSSGNRPWKVLLNIVPAIKGGKLKINFGESPTGQHTSFPEEEEGDESDEVGTKATSKKEKEALE